MVAITPLLALALAVVPAFSQFISGIQVVYGTKADQEPPGALQEVTGMHNDMNYQFGGDFVWLKPVYSSDPNGAVTGWDLQITNKGIPWAQDLAAGTGGDNRYIFPTYGGSNRITRLALYRLGAAPSRIPPPGYDAMSDDINKGRGKTFLYLVWKYETTGHKLKPTGSNLAAGGSQKYISDTVKEL
ncbi:hypothetical protein EXIGLDRAFT_745215 [Exidia glandulosa HHB12029]|uniref:Uncharacterized protein n=1 Tax=Exidia glandulosa HHB12029 TaxID=1314781 RepID=A0A165NU95_EXIGL|nr:hypothetical protein EXIGLDRAFT_745215 [Exidia glandulosa HHB12029]